MRTTFPGIGKPDVNSFFFFLFLTIPTSVNGQVACDCSVNLGTSGVTTSFESLRMAEQCPSVGGKAVFAARALLIPFGHEYQPDADCESGKPRVLQSEETTNVLLAPNPATDVLFVDLSEHPGVSELLITAMQGRVLEQTSISENMEQVELSVGGLPSGTYILTGMSNTTQVFTTRL